ncbi:Protein of unknown function DUF1639 [Macleaya cordata]|uniref:DUF1639 domain-containing protein n=1 Tax=Macleaya cordata TaxID=56857 RepID=A0A200QDB2_MACCD|nr:Protein of unknown function DUF1639 [Macleaya cordata]
MEIGEVVKNTNRGGGVGLYRSSQQHHHPEPPTTTTSSPDFVLQWGNRKRLRCMKTQVKTDSSTERTTVRVDRRVVRADKDSPNINFRRPFSPPPPPPPATTHRILRNSETSCVMKGQINGGAGGSFSPERGGEDKQAQDKKGNNNNHHQNHNHNHHHHHNHNHTNTNNNGVVGASGSSETAEENKKAGGSSSGSDAIPPVWPPKFVIALTNKEKEEDFMAIKGSKLPQRPKKRAKFIQRTLNLVSPGAWLCDLTLERYEVREKKISKKRPRGLKAMGNMESDSE